LRVGGEKMTHIQSILAATDFSSDARHAVERAAMLGTALALKRVVLLHVLEQSWIDSLKELVSSPADFRQEIIDSTSDSMAELLEDIRRLSGFSLEPQVSTGNALDAIVEAASEFDLLVLGARGRHPVRALALGTTSQRLLGKTRQPVLVVKRKPVSPYKRVLVAVDFSPNSSKALEYSSVIAPQAVVYLVHVFESLFEMKMRVSVGVSDEIIEEYRTKARLETEAELTRFLKETDVKSRNLVRIVEHGHAPSKLPEIARKYSPDLIIVGKHGRSRLEELFLGSVTVHMLSQSNCDVLVAQ
jgi:nucleotide-binding universal stress UspA family protein